MHSNYLLCDIELYPNYYEVGFKDLVTKQIFYFEVREGRDDRQALYNFLTAYKGYMITFNGKHYDNVVNAYFVKEYKWLSKLKLADFLKTLKSFSNLVIADDHEKTKWYKWYKHGWIDIDLFLYWAKSLRITKKISLKSLGIQLNHPRVQELPYPHDSILTPAQMDEVRDYNLNNDLAILETLCIRMNEEINLRKYINKEYGIECWSMDAPKICSEYMLEVFCKKTYNNQTATYEEYKRDVKSRRYTPKSGWKIGSYLPEVTFKTNFFKKLFEEIRESGAEFTRDFYYDNGSTRVHVSMGIGGIHIINENEYYESTNTHLVIDQDVTSLYPTLLELHKFIREELAIVIDEYIVLKGDRVNAKRLKQKIKDTFLKLMLNGFTGIVDQEVSWLYSPEQMTALRVYGQLIQLRVLEELSEAGIRVVSNNTDGTTAIVPRDKLDLYHKINEDISREFKVGWEYCIIDKIAYTNVNNYICFISKEYMTEDGKEINVSEKPKIKKKGLYKYGAEIPLGDSVNEQVVARALELYWKDSISVAESITNPEKYGFHIYDYCKSNRISKDFEVFHGNSKVQNLNRYYFQKHGAYLLKRKKGEKKFQHVNVGEGVCLFNNYIEKPFKEYDINYQHYIAKAQSLINDIKNKQLTLF
jgi:hypothetical protein